VKCPCTDTELPSREKPRIDKELPRCTKSNTDMHMSKM
jgi:hypothetical protein